MYLHELYVHRTGNILLFSLNKNDGCLVIMSSSVSMNE